MSESSGPMLPRRKRRYVPLLLLVGLLAYGFVRAVRHRFFQMELVHAQNDLLAIAHDLDEFAKAHSGQYPPDLSVLVTGKDPWRHEYMYEPPTPEHPEPRVWSLGADGKPGGTGEGADIYNHESPGSPR